MEDYKNFGDYDTTPTYEELCRKLISQNPKERVEAELEIMGRLLYWTGD